MNLVDIESRYIKT